AASTPFAKSRFLRAPFFWKSATSPGCDTEARSGGLPPATAVDRTVGVLSPVDLYETFTPGYFLVNPARTAWKAFCSAPVQTPTIEILPLTALVRCDVAPAVPIPIAAASARAPTSAAIANHCRFTLLLLSGSRRSLVLSGGRRNGVHACRRPLRSGRPAVRATVPRSDRPPPLRPRRRRSAVRIPRRRRPSRA